MNDTPTGDDPMNKPEAMTIVRHKYPLAILVINEALRMAELILDPIRPGSARYLTSGTASHAWASFARSIRDGSDF